jgi:hypothetical protein
MRLEGYLKEMYTDDAFGGFKSWPEIQEALIKDCMEILKFYHMMAFTSHTDLLQRAVSASIPTIEKRTSRTDRRPKDMEEEIHDLLDKYFLKQHGWKARSEGTFATFAWPGQIYGQTYLFFPFDGYKFLYNPDIADLWAKIPLKSYTEGNSVKLNVWIENAVKGYTDKNLAGAMKNSSEVMFKVNHYYLVNTRYERLVREFIINMPK